MLHIHVLRIAPHNAGNHRLVWGGVPRSRRNLIARYIDKAIVLAGGASAYIIHPKIPCPIAVYGVYIDCGSFLALYDICLLANLWKQGLCFRASRNSVTI